MINQTRTDGCHNIHPKNILLNCAFNAVVHFPAEVFGLVNGLWRDQLAQVLLHVGHKGRHGGLVETRRREHLYQRQFVAQAFNIADTFKKLDKRARRGAFALRNFRIGQHEIDTARIDAGAFGPKCPGFGLKTHGNVHHAGQHGIVHGGYGIIAAVGVGGEYNLPAFGQLPADEFVVLKQLHDAPEDAIVGAVYIINKQQARRFCFGHPLRRAKHGVFANNGGHADEVAHCAGAM